EALRLEPLGLKALRLKALGLKALRLKALGLEALRLEPLRLKALAGGCAEGGGRGGQPQQGWPGGANCERGGTRSHHGFSFTGAQTRMPVVTSRNVGGKGLRLVIRQVAVPK